MFKLIITGVSGTAGSEALRQALANPSISHVTVLSRRPLPPHIPSTNPKLTVIDNHSDFTSYSPSLLASLKGYDACLWDLGISANGMSEKDYTVTTVDYALAAAKAFAGLKEEDDAKKFVFCYLSGEGTTQVESKSWTMFGRVKGRAEKSLALLPSQGYPSLATYSFRPAGINPISPTPEVTGLMKFAIYVLPTMKCVMPKYIIDTDVLAKGMIEVALKGWSGNVKGWEGKGAAGDAAAFTNEEIKVLAMGV